MNGLILFKLHSRIPHRTEPKRIALRLQHIKN